MHLAEHIICLKSHLISDFDHCWGQTEMADLFEAPLEQRHLHITAHIGMPRFLGIPFLDIMYQKKVPIDDSCYQTAADNEKIIDH